MDKLIFISCFLNFILGGSIKEPFSSRVYRCNWKRSERFVNWIFQSDAHCRAAFIAYKRRTQK